MPQTGYCTDMTCPKELTELYECHCCNWLICFQHLLEHVDSVKKDNTKQVEKLRGDLTSASNTLELIVQKKIQEVECEKQLIHQAKTKLNTAGCSSMEEMQEIFEQINQAIASNGKEETIVKVEPSFSDYKTCMCTNDIADEKIIIADIYSPPMSIPSQPKSPVYRSLRFQTNQSLNSTLSKSNETSTLFENKFNSFNTDNSILDTTKDEADDDNHVRENSIYPKHVFDQCPLIFDGAFGATEAQHAIKTCPVEKSYKRYLLSHLKNKHRLTHIHAYRLLRAVQNGLDPKTVKLFGEDEMIIDYARFIPCPFTSGMISLIGCCPTLSQRIPCHFESVDKGYLRLHLRTHHRLNASTAATIENNYKLKLLQMKSSSCTPTHFI